MDHLISFTYKSPDPKNITPVFVLDRKSEKLFKIKDKSFLQVMGFGKKKIRVLDRLLERSVLDVPLSFDEITNINEQEESTVKTTLSQIRRILKKAGLFGSDEAIKLIDCKERDEVPKGKAGYYLRNISILKKEEIEVLGIHKLYSEQNKLLSLPSHLQGTTLEFLVEKYLEKQGENKRLELHSLEEVQQFIRDKTGLPFREAMLLQNFSGRKRYISRIVDIVDSNESAVIDISGYPGTGKTSLAACLSLIHKGPFILTKISLERPISRKTENVCLAMIRELSNKLGFEFSAFSTNPIIDLGYVFNLISDRIFGKKIICWVDGIDELEPNSLKESPGLIFPMPTKNVFLIFSHQNVKSFSDDLRQSSERVDQIYYRIYLPSFDLDETEQFFRINNIHLDEHQKEVIIQRSRGIPLYLRLMLDELIQDGIGIEQLMKELPNSLEDYYAKLTILVDEKEDDHNWLSFILGYIFLGSELITRVSWGGSRSFLEKTGLVEAKRWFHRMFYFSPSGEIVIFSSLYCEFMLMRMLLQLSYVDQNYRTKLNNSTTFNDRQTASFLELKALLDINEIPPRVRLKISCYGAITLRDVDYIKTALRIKNLLYRKISEFDFLLYEEDVRMLAYVAYKSKNVRLAQLICNESFWYQKNLSGLLRSTPNKNRDLFLIEATKFNSRPEKIRALYGLVATTHDKGDLKRIDMLIAKELHKVSLADRPQDILFFLLTSAFVDKIFYRKFDKEINSMALLCFRTPTFLFIKNKLHKDNQIHKDTSSMLCDIFGTKGGFCKDELFSHWIKSNRYDLSSVGVSFVVFSFLLKNSFKNKATEMFPENHIAALFRVLEFFFYLYSTDQDTIAHWNNELEQLCRTHDITHVFGYLDNIKCLFIDILFMISTDEYKSKVSGIIRGIVLFLSAENLSHEFRVDIANAIIFSGVYFRLDRHHQKQVLQGIERNSFFLDKIHSPNKSIPCFRFPVVTAELAYEFYHRKNQFKESVGNLLDRLSPNSHNPEEMLYVIVFIFSSLLNERSDLLIDKFPVLARILKSSLNKNNSTVECYTVFAIFMDFCTRINSIEHCAYLKGLAEKILESYTCLHSFLPGPIKFLCQMAIIQDVKKIVQIFESSLQPNPCVENLFLINFFVEYILHKKIAIDSVTARKIFDRELFKYQDQNTYILEHLPCIFFSYVPHFNLRRGEDNSFQVNLMSKTRKIFTSYRIDPEKKKIYFKSSDHQHFLNLQAKRLLNYTTKEERLCDWLFNICLITEAGVRYRGSELICSDSMDIYTMPLKLYLRPGRWASIHEPCGITAQKVRKVFSGNPGQLVSDTFALMIFFCSEDTVCMPKLKPFQELWRKILLNFDRFPFSYSRL